MNNKEIPTLAEIEDTLTELAVKTTLKEREKLLTHIEEIGGVYNLSAFLRACFDNKNKKSGSGDGNDKYKFQRIKESEIINNPGFYKFNNRIWHTLIMEGKHNRRELIFENIKDNSVYPGIQAILDCEKANEAILLVAKDRKELYEKYGIKYE